MATYNGEKYIEEQLDSILKQSYENWRLIIADDCSTDNTVAVIKDYQAKYPNKIILYQNEQPSGSARNNFFHLLDFSGNEYIMFADQDDVWLQDKVLKTLKKMISVENKYGKNIPLLVHTDLCVVDEELHIINESLFYMQDISADRNKLNNILIENIVTGCTMMINRKLANLLDTKPQKAIMHDMWMALVAATFGHIEYIDDATILYRQHNNNSVGAKNVHSLNYYIGKFLQKDKSNMMLPNCMQAEEFLHIYFNKLDKKSVGMLCEFSTLLEYGRIYKFISLCKYNLFKKNYLKMVAQILF